MALSKETDEASAERLDRLEGELSELKEQADAMAAAWQAEKAAIARIREAKSTFEEQRVEAERLERDGDLEGAAQVRYGELPSARHARSRRRPTSWPSSSATTRS